MAIYADLSGNSPMGAGHLDNRIGGHEDLQAITFRGTTHVFTLSGTAQPTPVFSNKCRAIRISMLGTGSANYAIGPSAVAVKGSDDLFTAGGIEIVKVHGGIDLISVIQNNAETDKIFITEDLS